MGPQTKGSWPRLDNFANNVGLETTYDGTHKIPDDWNIFYNFKN